MQPVARFRDDPGAGARKERQDPGLIFRQQIIRTPSLDKQGGAVKHSDHSSIARRQVVYPLVLTS